MGQNIPHYNMVCRQLPDLVASDTSIRRPEQTESALRKVQRGLQYLVALTGVIQIGFSRRRPPLQMIVGMVSNPMPGGSNLPEDLRVFSHIVADAKECRFRGKAGELFKHKLCGARQRTIIESEEQRLGLDRNSPGELRIEPGK